MELMWLRPSRALKRGEPRCHINSNLLLDDALAVHPYASLPNAYNFFPHLSVLRPILCFAATFMAADSFFQEGSTLFDKARLQHGDASIDSI
jgi:hypothetical protein